MPARWSFCKTIFIFLLLIANVSSGLRRFLVAKNKTAKQSTSWPGVASSISANDGDVSGRCFHTDKNDPLPWWMVDMGQTYAVYGVRVWNRIDRDDMAARFTQINIGISSDPSVWTTFNALLFDLCVYWTGLPTIASNPVNLTCFGLIAGQYLAVFMSIASSSTVRYLHFCEIDILAVSKELPYIVNESEPIFSPTSTSLLTTPSPAQKMSEAECLIQCSLLPNCLFALVRAAALNCWLFSSSRINSSLASVFNSDGARFLAVYG